MAQTVDKSRENLLAISQEMPLLSGTSSPKALNLPPEIVFAPAPTIPAAQSIPSEQIVIADRPAPLTRPRRRFRMERYEITIISLMLGCGALCLYRLIWAIQP